MMSNTNTPIKDFNELLFPSYKINPKDKGLEYHRSFAEAAYSYWYNNVASICTRDFQSKIDILRAYGDGDQPVDIYKDMILGKKKKVSPIHRGAVDNTDYSNADQIRKNYTNINWIIFSPASKFMRLLKAHFGKINQDVDCETLDPRGIEQKNEMKFRLYVESLFLEHDKRMRALGVDNVNESKFYPDNLQQLEWLQSVGSFKLSFEIAMEKVLDKSFLLGKWDKEIKDRIIEDLVNLNMFCTRDAVSQSTGAVVPVYTDVRDFIAEYSRTNGFNKSRFMGEARIVTIEEVGSSGEFTHEQLLEIARYSCNRNGNMALDKFDERYVKEGPESRWFYATKIYIMDLEFKDIDCKYMTKTKNAQGDDRYVRTKYGEKENENTNVVTTHTLRRVKWIIDTEYAYDWGVAKNVKRPSGKNVHFSWHPIVIPGKSITEQCIPIYDEIELNYLAKQNALAKASPPGVAIDISALENLEIGGKKHSAWDSVAMMAQTGNIFYKGTPTGGFGNYVQGKPYEKLQGGLGGQLNEFIVNHQQLMADLRETIGLTLPSSASGVDTKMGLGVSELAVDSSNDAVFTLLENYVFGKESVAMGIFLRIRALLKSPENRKLYNGKYPISEEDKVILEIPEDDISLQIRMKMRNNDRRSMTILQSATESLKAGKNGYVGITQSEFGFVEQLLDRGRILEANQFLAYCEDKHRKEDAAQKEKDMQMQGQIIQQQTQAATQGDIAKAAAIEAEKRKTIDHKAEADIRVIIAKSKNATIPEMAIESELEANGSNIDKN